MSWRELFIPFKKVLLDICFGGEIEPDPSYDLQDDK
jgi:hypothetical protein